MNITIKEAVTKSELKAFIKFNNELYKGCKYSIPYLVDDEAANLDRAVNPAFEVCDSVYYLAYKNGEIVGRIAGIINHKSNEIWGQKRVRFGFVDFIDDNEVVDALFAAVENWAKQYDVNEIHGPLGFTDLDHQGMLIEGFDQLATMATIYNYEYYPKQLERLGYAKDADWHEFKIYIPDGVPDKHLRIGEIIKKKYGLKVKKFSKRKEIMKYADDIFYVLNEAYSPLYAYTKLSKKQIDYYVDLYLSKLRLDFVTLIIREEDDRVVGVGVTLPSLSKALQAANGSLLPFGWFHLLKALFQKPKVIDLYLVGVLPEYQQKGVNALLFNDLIPIYQKLGVEYAESNPELEVNTAVQAQWSYFKREQHKARRAYIKPLTK